MQSFKERKCINFCSSAITFSGYPKLIFDKLTSMMGWHPVWLKTCVEYQSAGERYAYKHLPLVNE